MKYGFHNQAEKRRRPSYTSLEVGEGRVFASKNFPLSLQARRQPSQKIGFCGCNSSVGVYFYIDKTRCFAAHIDAAIYEGSEVSSTQTLGREEKILLRAAVIRALEDELAPVVSACRAKDSWWWFRMDATRIVSEQAATSEICNTIVEAVRLFVDSPMGLPDIGYRTPPLDTSRDPLRVKMVADAVLVHAADEFRGVVEHVGVEVVGSQFQSKPRSPTARAAKRWAWVLDHDRADLGWQRCWRGNRPASPCGANQHSK